MTHYPTLFAAFAAALLTGTSAHAVVCTGTQTVADGDVVAGSFLLTAGNCVEAGDKIFGEFSVGGAISGNGAASFSFQMTPGNVSIGFLGTVPPGQTGSLNYTVAVDPSLSQGSQIDNLEKDFTLNASLTGLPASATLVGFTSLPDVEFACTRTVNPQSGSCPQTQIFDPVDQLVVNETIATDANAVVTALTDTISQVPAAIPEPSSLALLGGALAGFAWVRRRQQPRPCPWCGQFGGHSIDCGMPIAP
jgi:hypothetical protein